MNSTSEIIAKIYDEHGKSYHNSRKDNKGRLHNEFIDMPAVFSLLPKNLDEVNILDAGCGSGFYAVNLAKKGAKVVGIDISDTMIKIANEEKPTELKIDYLVGGLTKLPFSDSKFDFVICAYVLENIEDITETFSEFSRVLKNKGSCIFSVSHPLRACSKKVEEGGLQCWKVENYFEKGTRLSDFGNGMIVPKYRRTIQDYFNAFTAAGFLAKRLLEPQPVKEGEIVDPNGYQTAMRLPEVLTVEVVKNK